MNPVPFIDIHTHLSKKDEDTVTVRNIFPGGAIPAFSGRDFFSVGLHPRTIKSHQENNELLIMMEDALEFDHVIFVGECGLDKNVETDFNEQLRVFEAQAFMAEEYKKPLIVHCVKAYKEIFGINKKIHPALPWIFHGYHGDMEITRQLIQNNILFSFGELLFKPYEMALDSFIYLPSERIFFETDEFEGDIGEIYDKGSNLKNMSLERLKVLMWENFNRIENIRF